MAWVQLHDAAGHLRRYQTEHIVGYGPDVPADNTALLLSTGALGIVQEPPGMVDALINVAETAVLERERCVAESEDV